MPSLKLMVLFYQLGMVDTFTFVQFCINSGAQYASIVLVISVLASASGNFSSISPKMLLEPITGLEISYQYIQAGKTVAERQARIATLN